MQINAMIKLNDEESTIFMLLTPRNSTNPLFWGKDIKYVINGEIVEPNGIKIPNEFDFFNAWCGKDKQNAREYYKKS